MCNFQKMCCNLFKLWNRLTVSIQTRVHEQHTRWRRLIESKFFCNFFDFAHRWDLLRKRLCRWSKLGNKLWNAILWRSINHKRTNLDSAHSSKHFETFWSCRNADISDKIYDSNLCRKRESRMKSELANRNSARGNISEDWTIFKGLFIHICRFSFSHTNPF